MPEFDINGVPVKFPFEPYDVQRRYMEKVIATLNEKQTAFLESPTGTGKTLCLLCATLGWIENENKKMRVKNENGAMGDRTLNNNTHAPNDVQNRPVYRSSSVPIVIYASRTHSQLTQAMNELKRTEYNYMKAGLIASRDQLCINEELACKSNTDKSYICQLLQKERYDVENRKGCKYFQNVADGVKHLKESNCSIADIEDLCDVGKRTNACPYHMSKKMVIAADIIFMPYNYLLDPKIRHAVQINLENAIVILDEAHNVENMCEESACTKITSTKIGIAIRDMKYIIEKWSPDGNTSLEMDIELRLEDVTKLAVSIQKLDTEISNIVLKSPEGDPHDANFIFDLLEKAEINESNQDFIIDLLSNLIKALVKKSRQKISMVTENGVVQQKCPEGIGLRALSTFLRVAFASSIPELEDCVNTCYKVWIEQEPERKIKNSDGAITTEKPDPKAKQINFWCFSAKFGMHYLTKKQIRSLIFTSGTLAPLKPLITEMGFSNPFQLTNPHIVRPYQVCVKIVSSGPDNTPLNSSYNNRNNVDYLRSIGKTVLEFSKTVPDGLLVFFPSYPVMNTCTGFWHGNDMWRLINEQKRIFVEPKTKEEFLDTMKNYYAEINAGNGAIFMAVMRGKVSEGLDFADMYGRGVIVVGIPLAPYKEPKIVLKKKYLDANRTRENEMLSGSEWYSLSAVRAINQAIGRVIRHKNDYGAILFCENRFHDKKYKKDISSWLQNYLTNDDLNQSFDSIINNLRQFYENAAQTLPKPKPKTAPEVEDFEDDLPEASAFVELPSNEFEGLELVTQNVDDDYDYGPPPETPFKPSNVGTKICCKSTSQSVCGHQIEVKPKRRKIFIDSNGNDSVFTQDETNVLQMPGFGNSTKELEETLKKYKEDCQYELCRDSFFKILEAARRTGMLRHLTPVFMGVHKARFEKDVGGFIKSESPG